MSIHMKTITLDDVRIAKRAISPYVKETPLLRMTNFESEIGREIYVKCENLQTTGSFKLRGATNKILALKQADSNLQGVVTASSGNHGQAVAYAAKQFGVTCVVVVPETVLAVKEQAILAYGAECIRCGTTSNERLERAEEIASTRGLRFVPPYDDLHVAAGQGTLGLEVVQTLPNTATVLVPIGGGGLISGVATAVKGSLANVRVIGVEPELANDTYLSLKHGKSVDIGETKTMADGLRTSHPGVYTFPIVQERVDEVLLVTEEEIECAGQRLLHEAKLVVEPSGATAFAAVLRYGASLDGPIVCVLSGGNIAGETLARWV